MLSTRTSIREGTLLHAHVCAGGISTSLLFSAFESWVVGEHLNRGFDPKWLGDTFSKVRATAPNPALQPYLCSICDLTQDGKETCAPRCAPLLRNLRFYVKW